LALPFAFDDDYRWTAAGGFMLAAWILFATLRAAADRIFAGGGRGSRGFWGMIIAHSGVAVFVAGVCAVSVYQLEKDVRLAAGEGAQLGAYQFALTAIGEEQGENYRAIVGDVRVWRDGEQIARLRPEKRTYFAQPENQMTEAGIAAGLGGDWYVSLGEPLGDGAWSARLQYKPWVRFIWGGAILMALGGIAAMADRRYRRRRQAGGE
jgi:cytochrome c-type biogenesis protein CcmF